MNSSDIHSRFMLFAWDYAFAESVEGRMDFNVKYTLASRGLIVENGDVKQFDKLGGFMLMGNGLVAYNLNDAGQFLWGHAMKRIGTDYSTAKMGSEAFARTSEFNWDTKADQKAIREGYFYRVIVNTAKAGTFEGLPIDDWGRGPRRK